MKTVKQVLILIGVAFLFAGLTNLIHPGRIPWVEDWANRVEAQAVSEKVALVQLSEVLDFLREDSRLFVDARSAAEYANGHIPGAVLASAELTELLNEPRPLVLYCTGVECEDSLLLALELRKLGREDISIFIGGMDIWRSELLSVEERDD